MPRAAMLRDMSMRYAQPLTALMACPRRSFELMLLLLDFAAICFI